MCFWGCWALLPPTATDIKHRGESTGRDFPHSQRLGYTACVAPRTRWTGLGAAWCGGRCPSPCRTKPSWTRWLLKSLPPQTIPCFHDRQEPSAAGVVWRRDLHTGATVPIPLGLQTQHKENPAADVQLLQGDAGIRNNNLPHVICKQTVLKC